MVKYHKERRKNPMKIVPTSRLVFWTGLIFLPFATLTTAIPSVSLLSWSIMSALFVTVIADSFLARRNLEGFQVEMPDIVRLSQGREGNIEIRIRNEKTAYRHLKIAFVFPGEIVSSQNYMAVHLPPEIPLSFFLWPCRGIRQGRYLLDTSCLEVSSPLGLWDVRTTVPVHTEIRVYPDLMSERQGLASLFLRNHAGIHARQRLGKGRDFDQLREYVQGDSFEDIHWKATAKRGRPISRVWQLERTQQIYVILDSSRLSARSAAAHCSGAEVPADSLPDYRMTIMEKYVTSALVMGLAAQRQGDQFGIMTFSDRVKHFVRAGNGKAHYQICRDMLCTLQTEGVTPDFGEVFTFIGTRIRRRGLLIFLTHLDDPAVAESFISHIDIIRRQHLVMVNMIRPERARPLFTNPGIASEDDLYAELGGHMLWHSLHEVEKVLMRRGVGFSLTDCEKLSADMVSRYIEIKQRQRL